MIARVTFGAHRFGRVTPTTAATGIAVSTAAPGLAAAIRVEVAT